MNRSQPLRRSSLKRISPRQRKRAKELAATKLRLIAERGARCEHCQTAGALDLHHVVARSVARSDEDANLLLLCKGCHRFTEEFPAAAEAVGLVKRGYTLPVRKLPLSHVRIIEEAQ